VGVRGLNRNTLPTTSDAEENTEMKGEIRL